MKPAPYKGRVSLLAWVKTNGELFGQTAQNHICSTIAFFVFM